MGKITLLPSQAHYDALALLTDKTSAKKVRNRALLKVFKEDPERVRKFLMRNKAFRERLNDFINKTKRGLKPQRISSTPFSKEIPWSNIRFYLVKWAEERRLRRIKRKSQERTSEQPVGKRIAQHVEQWVRLGAKKAEEYCENHGLDWSRCNFKLDDYKLPRFVIVLDKLTDTAKEVARLPFGPGQRK